MKQPEQLNVIRLACCRCGAEFVVSREQLDALDRASRTALCCEGCEAEKERNP